MLLILAGDNGILTKAQEASENTKRANAEDANKGTSWEVAKTLKGNQFVWVPVEDDSAFKTYEGYKNGDIDSKLENCKEPYENGYANEVSEYNAMKESVLDHDEFYVGRKTGGVVQKAKEFVDEKDYTSITSTLMYGVQWDTIMAWIEPRYRNKKRPIRRGL